jgi:hypothetical protein
MLFIMFVSEMLQTCFVSAIILLSASLAQLVEQLTFNQWVHGSSP